MGLPPRSSFLTQRSGIAELLALSYLTVIDQDLQHITGATPVHLESSP